MNGITSVPSVRVEVGEGPVVGHVGLHLLGDLADRLGLTDALGAVVSQRGERPPVHDRGRMLVQTLVALAGGGNSIADLRVLRNQPDLFGEVASDPTFWRLFTREASASTPAAIMAAIADTRAAVWKASPPEEVVLDIDATLFEIHSEHKRGTAATYKGGFGFAPMLCTLDTTGEPLAGMLRPGNATANSAADQIAVVDAAITALPPQWQAGHRPGDDLDSVVHPLLVRSDSAGHVRGFLDALVARNVQFSVTGRYHGDLDTAIWALPADAWQPALAGDSEVRADAHVAELHGVTARNAPHGTRVIVRREKAHPGAQLKLWDRGDWRFQVVLTNQSGDAVAIELRHRRHARVENAIKNLKDTGLERMPFSGLTANEAWFACVLAARTLTCWLQQLCLDGDLAKAAPATLRYRLLHMPAMLVRHGRRLVLRFLAHWPWAAHAHNAYRRLHRFAI